MELVLGSPVNYDSHRWEGRRALRWWPDPPNFNQGIPTGVLQVQSYLYTDSGSVGWGAHLEHQTPSSM